MAYILLYCLVFHITQRRLESLVQKREKQPKYTILCKLSEYIHIYLYFDILYICYLLFTWEHKRAMKTTNIY